MKKAVVNELKGFLKQRYDFSVEAEFDRAYDDLKRMFTIGTQKKINGLWVNVNDKYSK